MEEAQAQLESLLESLPDEPVVIPITNISRHYAERVEELVNGLTDPAIKMQAIDIIQSMIERVTITPENYGFSIDLHGKLGRILEIVSEKEQRPRHFRIGAFAFSGCGGRI